MIRNLAVFVSLAVGFSGSFALSTKSAEAKVVETRTAVAKTADSKAATSRSDFHIPRNFLVPPPPPYTPSIVSSELGMMDGQAFSVERAGSPYSKYTFTHGHGEIAQVGQPKSYVSFDPSTEKKIQKHIETFDSDISSVEKEIGKLLNL